VKEGKGSTLDSSRLRRALHDGALTQWCTAHNGPWRQFWLFRVWHRRRSIPFSQGQTRASIQTVARYGKSDLRRRRVRMVGCKATHPTAPRRSGRGRGAGGGRVHAV